MNGGRAGVGTAGQVHANLAIDLVRILVLSAAEIYNRLAPDNPKMVRLPGREIGHFLVDARGEGAVGGIDVLGTVRVPALVRRVRKIDLVAAEHKPIPIIGITDRRPGHRSILDEVIRVFGTRTGRDGRRMVYKIQQDGDGDEDDDKQA